MTEQDVLPIGEEPRQASPRIEALLTDYAVLRTNRERIDDERRAALAKEAVAEAKLFDALEQLGLRSVKHDELGTFALNDLAWPATTDPVALRTWLLENAPEVLIANATKLATVVREAVRGERDMPPGVEAKFTRKINWRKTHGAPPEA